MEIFEYPAHTLAHVTYSGKQDSKKPWCNIRRVVSEYIAYFVVEGEIFLEEDGTPYHLTKGAFFQLEPGKLHFGTRYTDCIFYYVHFLHPDIKKRECTEISVSNALESAHAAWLTCAEDGPYPTDFISFYKRGRAEDRTAFTSLCYMFEQLISRQTLRLEHFNILGAQALSEIFIELTRQSARALFRSRTRGESASERLNSVLLYLHANYRHTITSVDIEKELSYNFDYLNQLFSRHLHTSIFKLLENIRIEAAKHILKTRSLPIKEIAGEVGFTDEAYFSKVFKKRTGCSPTEYREHGTGENL